MLTILAVAAVLIGGTAGYVAGWVLHAAVEGVCGLWAGAVEGLHLWADERGW